MIKDVSQTIPKKRRKLSPVESYIKKYGISPDQWAKSADSDRIIILKSGINQIKQKAGISITIKDSKINEAANSRTGAKDESVYLIGEGSIYNKLGNKDRKVDSTASATPGNCEFPFKMETAEARLNARIVLLLTDAGSMFLAEAELNSKKIDDPAPPDPKKSVLSSTLKELTKSDRS
jgi:hypothetical protein